MSKSHRRDESPELPLIGYDNPHLQSLLLRRVIDFESFKVEVRLKLMVNFPHTRLTSTNFHRRWCAQTHRDPSRDCNPRNISTSSPVRTSTTCASCQRSFSTQKENRFPGMNLQAKQSVFISPLTGALPAEPSPRQADRKHP